MLVIDNTSNAAIEKVHFRDVAGGSRSSPADWAAIGPGQAVGHRITTDPVLRIEYEWNGKPFVYEEGTALGPTERWVVRIGPDGKATGNYGSNVGTPKFIVEDATR